MSAEHCFFCQEALDALGKVIRLDGQEFKHLCRVLRAKVGDAVGLRDGAGGWAEGIVVEIGRDWAGVEVVECGRAADDRLPVTVILCRLKRDALELALHKLCEIGVARIVPVECRRTVARSRGREARQQERWLALAISALKQSRGFYLTEIDGVHRDLASALSSLEQRTTGIVMQEHGAPPHLFDLLARMEAQGRIAVAVGPEGGFHHVELDRLHAAGFLSASLGSRVLRAETAVLVAGYLAGHFYYGKGR